MLTANLPANWLIPYKFENFHNSRRPSLRDDATTSWEVLTSWILVRLRSVVKQWLYIGIILGNLSMFPFSGILICLRNDSNPSKFSPISLTFGEKIYSAVSVISIPNAFAWVQARRYWYKSLKTANLRFNIGEVKQNIICTIVIYEENDYACLGIYRAFQGTWTTPDGPH